jgi:hypothetical protein
MNQQQLKSLIYQEKHNFGIKCKKFSGSLTVELIRQTLLENNLEVSQRDVFIRGIDVEIDLLIAKRGVIPIYRLYYNAEDVLAVIEIKAMGSFGESTITKTRDNFSKITQNNNIYCAYVTLTERKGFKWAVTTEKLGFPAFTLFWHQGNDIENAEPSSDYQLLLDKLRTLN